MNENLEQVIKYLENNNIYFGMKIIENDIIIQLFEKLVNPSLIGYINDKDMDMSSLTIDDLNDYDFLYTKEKFQNNEYKGLLRMYIYILSSILHFEIMEDDLKDSDENYKIYFYIKNGVDK
jgi:hypothetical protein